MQKDELEQKVNEYEINKEKGIKKDKKTKLKYLLNISLVLIVTTFALFISLKDNTSDIWSNLIKADIKYLLVVVGIMIGCILVRSFILFCFARLYTRDYRFHQAIAVDQIGVFYNAVTPGASGGQIMQAYTYKKQGLQVSNAVSILAMYSIVFQTILIIYGLVSFIIKYDFINSLGSINTGIKIDDVPINIPMWPLTIIGFLLNVGVILIVLLMGYWHSFHNFIMGPVIYFLNKIKLCKDPNKTRENLRIQVENFKIEFRRLLTNIPFTILVSISFVIYMALKFSVPYFVGLALGNESQVASFWDCIFLSNYHQMVTGLIPVPGSAGISELVFYNLFVNSSNPEQGFFCAYVNGVADAGASKNLCRSALLMWRSMTFVLPLMAAGFVTAFYRASPKEVVSQSGSIPNRQTFVSLQNETFVQRQAEVDTLVETTKLSRDLIVKKLRETRKKQNKKKRVVESPTSISQSEYQSVSVHDFDEDNKK